jgi:hypothetical protein
LHYETLLHVTYTAEIISTPSVFVLWRASLLMHGLQHVDDYLRLAFGKGRPENTALETVILLVNSAIGSGILNQPYVFYQAGIGSACVLYPLGAVVTWAGEVASSA